MFLKRDHTYSTVDLFKMFDVNKVKGKRKGKIARKYKCQDKRTLAQQIFSRYLHMLLSDLVQGGKIFYFPSKHLSSLKMVRIEGDEFKAFRKRGFFKDIDFLISNFSGYFLAMEYYNTKGRRVKKHIALSKNFVEVITQKTNEGYRYC